MAQFEAGAQNLITRVLERSGHFLTTGREGVRAADPPRDSKHFWQAPGIAGSTRVMTNFGLVPAHLVRVRDVLRTRDGGFLPVQKIEVYRLDEAFLARHADAAPVVIRKGSLSLDMPKQDVALSPAQMVGVGGGRICDGLLPARELSRQRTGISSTMGMLAYFQFHFSRSAQINCEGIWVLAEAD